MTGSGRWRQSGDELGTASIPGGGAVQVQVWTVAALLLAVSDALAARFAAVSVRGELVNFTRAASGHCYFTLKDGNGASAGLRCAMFRRAAQMMSFQPAEGQQVDLRGRLAVYEARGELQLVVESMQRVGVGSLYEDFLRLKARLQAQGLFSPDRKRTVPAFPRCIAVVTSLAGAALHDVLTTLQRRAPHVLVRVFPSMVQGSEAPPALVSALAAANADGESDLIILCRGGGSLEDLWAFNDERVVRAIVASDRPVVCGVGHETDITLADLAADLRAPTPTAAAELAAPACDALMQDLQARAERLRQRMHRRLEGAMLQVDQLSLRLRQPGHRIAREAARLDALSERHGSGLRLRLQAQARQQLDQARCLRRAVQAGLALRQGALNTQAARLAALDPRQVLQRGYAWMEHPDGRPAMSAAVLVVGQSLRAVWSDGRAEVTVEAIEVAQTDAPPNEGSPAHPKGTVPAAPSE
jgi:exodeoxyribonuclease VII large subunit